MGCIASKKPEARTIELTEVEVTDNQNVMGLTKRQRLVELLMSRYTICRSRVFLGFYSRVPGKESVASFR